MDEIKEKDANLDLIEKEFVLLEDQIANMGEANEQQKIQMQQMLSEIA